MWHKRWFFNLEKMYKNWCRFLRQGWNPNFYHRVDNQWNSTPNNRYTPLTITLDIGLVVRVFANGPRDLGSIPGRVIPKTQKMVLDASLLNTQHYKVRIKWSNPGKGVAPSSTPWCSSYWKGNLRVTLDYGRQVYLL